MQREAIETSGFAGKLEALPPLRGFHRSEDQPLKLLHAAKHAEARTPCPSSREGKFKLSHYPQLGRKYGISTESVWRIRNNRGWRHVA